MSKHRCVMSWEENGLDTEVSGCCCPEAKRGEVPSLEMLQMQIQCKVVTKGGEICFFRLVSQRKDHMRTNPHVLKVQLVGNDHNIYSKFKEIG